MENHYFIDKVSVLIDGNLTEIFTITGSGGYDESKIKIEAIDMGKKLYPNSNFNAEILTHNQVTLEEFQKQLGINPPWLGSI